MRKFKFIIESKYVQVPDIIETFEFDDDIDNFEIDKELEDFVLSNVEHWWEEVEE